MRDKLRVASPEETEREINARHARDILCEKDTVKQKSLITRWLTRTKEQVHTNK